MDNQNQYITASEASRIIGVTRQTISGMKKIKSYDFFVTVDGKPRIDTESSSWKHYLYEASLKQEAKSNPMIISSEPEKLKPKQKKPTANNKDKPEPVVIRNKKNQVQLDKDSAIGYDIETFQPQNLADLKRLAEIKKIDLDMMIKLSQVIHKELVVNILLELGNIIQSQFVDLPRKISSDICMKLDREGMEKEVEKLLAPPIQKGIQEFKKVAKKITRLKNEG
jgi:hypothetical protein